MRIRLVAAVLLVFAAPAAAAPRATDPPRVVPWHLIGNVGLGMSRARVERMYGRGTIATPPRDELFWTYRGRGAIGVAYDIDGHVDSVETTSSAYASRSGIRVGIKLPPRLCGLVDYTCKHSWRGFTYESDYKSWKRVSRLGRFERSYVELELGPHSVVKRISLTHFLACPFGEYAIRNACRKPPPGADSRFYFPPPAGLRFCEFPGGPGNFVAASPSVSCRLANDVISKLGSCMTKTRCTTDGFGCVAEWAGRYDASFGYTHHAICTDGAHRRIVWDGG
ncbi:MAG: hypothetical protein QOH73_2581 [Gaiellaceae bacterium]|jgi:hypothetical protein|nr:hypothetical protein [Gaiellaceae bacterium]